MEIQATVGENDDADDLVNRTMHVCSSMHLTEIICMQPVVSGLCDDAHAGFYGELCLFILSLFSVRFFLN